ncbi:PREDICTED: chromatin modification-related protein eaf-1-like [Chinchilla lanigera]|uniref:chromatin modification-related protein eaf-1-like n=1 Tax=Chinchilla lanigera TaxID=34839 RepID=UPI000696DBA6|nr:PREDICTED: chromatin modification-related protein eaf-1-like [Chinchilla lanigera]
MIQGALETSGPLWGWDGNGEDDWGGAVLTLLALAVVAATALALHWFGSRQDQEVVRREPTAPRGQPAQVGAARRGPQPQSKFWGLEGQSSGPGKPDSPGRGQAAPAPAEARDQASLRGRSLALPPLRTPSEVASRGTMRQQRDPIPGALRGDGSEPPKPDGDLQARSKARGTPAPLLIHFTPRSPGCEAALQVDTGGMGARGRGRSGRRRRGDTGLGDRRGRPARPDPLRLGAAASVWDAVDAAAAARGTQGARGPEEGLPWVNPGCPPGRGNAWAEASGRVGTEMHGDPCVGKRTGSPKSEDNKQAAQGSFFLVTHVHFYSLALFEGRRIEFAEQINKMEARPRRQAMKEKEHQVVRHEEQKAEQEEGKVAQREEELEETGNQHNDVEIEEAGEEEEKEVGLVHSDAEKEQEEEEQKQEMEVKVEEETEVRESEKQQDIQAEEVMDVLEMVENVKNVIAEQEVMETNQTESMEPSENETSKELEPEVEFEVEPDKECKSLSPGKENISAVEMEKESEEKEGKESEPQLEPVAQPQPLPQPQSLPLPQPQSQPQPQPQPTRKGRF